MPYALDSERGETLIETRGQACRIVFQTDRVRREPRIDPPEIGSSDVQIGTRITVRWPSTACDALDAAEGRFVQLASAFTTFNPHLTLRCHWDGKDVVNVSPTNSGWTKWRTCDPTSAHWYSAAEFERYIAAHVARDQDEGRTGRMVRDFIEDLRGLSRPGKQKVVLAETDTARTPLADFFARGSAAVAQLLESCKRHTALVKPESLGLLGADHLRADCAKLGGAEASFRYKKYLGLSKAGLPYVIEAAFAYCPERDIRQVIAGVNFSVAINNPFRRLGAFDDLSSVLNRNYIEHDDPVVVVMHYVCPHVDFSDHGKSTLALPIEAGHRTVDLIAYVAKVWVKIRHDEERHEIAEARRCERLCSRSCDDRKNQNRCRPPARWLR